MKNSELDTEKSQEEVMNETEEDPQFPDESEEFDSIRVTDTVQRPRIVITVSSGSKLDVNIEGPWKSRLIRAVPGAIFRAMRRIRLNKYKTLNKEALNG